MWLHKLHKVHNEIFHVKILIRVIAYVNFIRYIMESASGDFNLQWSTTKNKCLIVIRTHYKHILRDVFFGCVFFVWQLTILLKNQISIRANFKKWKLTRTSSASQATRAYIYRCVWTVEYMDDVAGQEQVAGQEPYYGKDLFSSGAADNNQHQACRNAVKVGRNIKWSRTDHADKKQEGK